MKKYIQIISFLIISINCISQNNINYVYDNQNRLSQVNYPNGTNITYQFDNVSNRTSMVINATTTQADLSVNNLLVNPASSNAGSNINLQCTILNSGSTAAGANHLNVYLSPNTSPSGQLLTSVFLNSVPANGSAQVNTNITIPTTTSVGSYYIVVKADGNEAVSESNENNNMASTPISVTANQMADLEVQSFSLTNTNPEPGSSTNFSGTLINNGSIASGNFILRCYLSLNSSFELYADELISSDVNISNLTGGGTQSFNGSISLSTLTIPDTYYVICVADATTSVSESDETNNSSSVQILVANTSSSQSPVANFESNTQYIGAGGQVNFTDLSTNNPTSWVWSFPGGTPSFSSQQNPTVSYSSNGVFDVSLTTSNSNGSDSKTESSFITVGNTSISNADWDWAYSTGSSQSDRCNDIFIDNSGNIYIVGEFKGQVIFGGTTLTNNYSRKDMFLVKYDTNNNVVFAKQTTGSSTGGGAGKAITVDNYGNIYVTGAVKSNFNFGNGILINANATEEDIFLAKFNSNGIALWANHIGNNQYYNSGFDVATDNTGNIYITGTFAGNNVNFGNSQYLTSQTSTAWGYWRNVFVAKYNSSGNCLWASNKNYTSDVYSNSISTGVNNDVYLSTGQSILVKFNSTTGIEIWDVPGSGLDNYYKDNKIHVSTSSHLKRYNDNGTFINEKFIGAYSSLKLDVDENIYLAGYYSGTLILDGLQVTSNGNSDVFSAKLDSSLNTIYIKSAGSIGNDYIQELAIHPNNDIYCVGHFENSVAFGSYTLVSNGGEDMFIAKHGNLSCPNINPLINASQLTACTGDSILLSVPGGYNQFTWSNSQTDASIFVNQSGDYSCLVTDANGCSGQSDTIAVEFISITTPVITLSNSGTSCSGSSATLSTTNNSNYNYRWFKNGLELSGLVGSSIVVNESGSYTVEVSFGGNCTAVSSAYNLTLTPYIPLVIQIDESNLFNCNGVNNGSIDISVSDGLSPYSYNWSNGQTSQDISVSSAGTYSLTVTDFNQCTQTTSVLLNTPTPFAVQGIASDVSCNGNNDGIIQLSVFGGDYPISYTWSNGSQSEDLYNLQPGNYSVSIVDNQGCGDILSFQVYEPASILCSPNLTMVSNPGLSNGTIQLNLSGGTSPYFFQWSNGATSENITNLSQGNYTVTVNDIHNCTSIFSFAITTIAPLTASVVTSDISCNGGNNGYINLSVSGGSTPYAFNWSNGSIFEDLYNISAGNYSLTITDSQGNSIDTSFVLSNPDELYVNSTITNATNSSTADGKIEITINGGTPLYTYLWSNGATTANIYNLFPGLYSLSVTDQNECVNTTSFEVLNLNGMESFSKFNYPMLFDNSPNPFSADTEFSFFLPVQTYVEFSIANNLGNMVEMLISRDMLPGKYSFKYKIQNLNAGTYYYRLQTTMSCDTKKMVIIKKE